MNNESIVGKIIVQGNLHLESPLIIGSGKDDLADIEVLKDKNGAPYIPGTSVIGVLKHYFEDNFKDNFPENTEDFKYFWGYDNKQEQESIQSSFICHDLNSSNAKIIIRDGIKIDPKSQVAEDKGKYDFEIIEKGAVFDLFWEVTVRQIHKIHNKDTFERIVATIMEPLTSGSISIGAKTNNGFGKCKLENVIVAEFDFKNKEDVFKWLKQDFSSVKSSLDKEIYQKKNNDFTIDAKFAMKNSIIIRSYSDKPDMPDSSNITSNGDFVLPGTSLKGAIRNRAAKILTTLKAEGAQQRIEDLFGTAGEKEDNDKIKIRKSRVTVEEKVIRNIEPEQQTRIKIDRFTGGTVKSALFNSMPLWNKEENSESINIIIKIRKFEPWEAGLLLQVLKDLWCEDLAIGGEKNVGRGILKGISAIIKWEDEKTHMLKQIELTSNEKGISFSDESTKKDLNRFAKSILGVV